MIVNAGTITVADGGIAALVAPAVKNTGVIGPLGTIELAAATRFTDLFVTISCAWRWRLVWQRVTDVQGTP
jgi:hypothetical protein